MPGLERVRGTRKIIDDLQEAVGLLLDESPSTNPCASTSAATRRSSTSSPPQWFMQRARTLRKQLLQAGEQIDWHPAAHESPLPGLGGESGLGLVHLAPAPLGRALSGLALPASVDRKLWRTRSKLPIDPTESRPNRPCALRSNDLKPGDRRHGHLGHLVAHPTDRRRHGWTITSFINPVSPYVAAPAGTRDHSHLGLLYDRQVTSPFWNVALERDRHLGLGIGAGRRRARSARAAGAVRCRPMEMIEKYSADAVRYWAASTGLGKDSVISEEKIQVGARLANKLWNVARFSQRFLLDYDRPSQTPPLSPADRWLLSQLQRLVAHATEAFERYEYASAIRETESFFWGELADNYLEMVKKRLYDEEHPGRAGALFTLERALSTVLKLFAPFIPHVTERVYQALFSDGEDPASIHRSEWPRAEKTLLDEGAEAAGELLKTVATVVRRFKSERNLSLGSELSRLQLSVMDAGLARLLDSAKDDISSIARANEIEIGPDMEPELEIIFTEASISIAVAL